MRCSYCGEERDSTNEHIISNSILELFPECNVTYDGFRNKVYKNEPTINDVCSDCNNKKLTYIDSFAKEMIAKYFTKDFTPDFKLVFEYDYVMLMKMLLKFTFNDLRSHKEDLSFFNKSIKSFLLNQDNKEYPQNVLILAGLAINTSSVPSYVFENKKIIWFKNPKFLAKPIISYYDYESGMVKLNELFESQVIDELKFSYLFRFNTLQIIILFFEDNLSTEKQRNLLPLFYPYTALSSIKTKVILERCTHAYNYHNPQLIDVSWGLANADDTNSMLSTNINPLKVQKHWNKDWNTYESNIRLKSFEWKESQKHKKAKKKKN